MNNINDKLIQHVNQFWPDNEKMLFKWDFGKIKDILPDFRVIRVKPRHSDEPWVYLTLGIWQIDKENNVGEEFFILCQEEDPMHVENLAMLACFYADTQNSLAVGVSINLGRPWVNGSSCKHFLISLPYPYGPDLGVCKIDEELTINYSWLLPITEKENQFLNNFGLEMLESRFDEYEIDAIDPLRYSVVL